MSAPLRNARLWPLQVFVLLALVARVFMPPGYMLAAVGSTSWVKVVLCSAHGPIEVFVDPVTYEITDKPALPAPKPDGDPPCAFASLAKLAPPAAPLEVAGVQSAEAAAPAFAYRGNPELGLSAPPPPATGPPHHHA
jgi:hypothetical protein